MKEKPSGWGSPEGLGVTCRAVGAAAGALVTLGWIPLSQVFHAWSSWSWDEDPREQHNTDPGRKKPQSPLLGDDDDELQTATNTTLFWVTQEKRRLFPCNSLRFPCQQYQCGWGSWSHHSPAMGRVLAQGARPWCVTPDPPRALLTR